MKFKAKNGQNNAVIWDSTADKALCVFRNGFAEVENKNSIAKMQNLGFEAIKEPAKAVEDSVKTVDKEPAKTSK